MTIQKGDYVDVSGASIDTIERVIEAFASAGCNTTSIEHQFPSSHIGWSDGGLLFQFGTDAYGDDRRERSIENILGETK